MKNTMILISIGIAFALGFFACNRAHAGEVEVQLIQRSLVNNDVLYRANFGGIQLNYHFEDSPLYVFAGQDNADIYAPQETFAYTFTGLGLGFRHQTTKYFQFFGQAGYYKIENSWGYQPGVFNEGIHYMFNLLYWGTSNEHRDGELYFQDFEVINDDYTYGVTAGVKFNYPVTENFNVGVLASYRALSFQEHIIAHIDHDTNRRWVLDSERDFGTINIALSASYQF